MKRFIVIAVLISLVIASIIYFSMEMGSQHAAEDAAWLDANDDIHPQSSYGDSASESVQSNIQRPSEEIVMSVTDSDPLVLNRVFAYELSLVDGFAEMALSRGWSHDAQMKNLSIWHGLCSAADADVSALLSASNTGTATVADIEKLCADYDSVMQAIEDVLEVEEIEREFGMDERTRLESSLEDFGPDFATRSAIAELAQALDALNYARALEIVWFLGLFDFAGVSEELSVYSRRPNPETVFAVTTAIFCGNIGGCDSDHPLTLNLCFLFQDLPCGRAPASVYDAIDQILTGHEIDTFNEMNQSLIRLLNRHRLGGF